MYSYHSMVRANERTRYSGKTAIRFVENGVTRGRGAESFGPREREYLNSLPYDGCTARVYNGFCFIIGNDNKCVTLYELPKWFGRKSYYDGAERIRNRKRFEAFRVS